MSIAKPQTTSLIDTVSAGFAAVNRRVWLVAIPVLLNLAVWYGAQVSFQPLINSFVTLLERTTPAVDREAANPVYENWRLLGLDDLTQVMDRLRLVPRLAVYAANPGDGGLPLPTEVLPTIDPNRVVFTVTEFSTALLLLIAVNALLIPLGALFYALVALAVRGEQFALGGWLRAIGRTTVSLLGYAALLLAATLLGALPVIILGALLLTFVPPLGAFALVVVLILSFWINIYIGFAPEVIAVAGLDPILALRTSVALVRTYFWATLVLLLVLFVVNVGLGVVWGLLARSSIGLLAAVVGSSYIGSGLVAARMMFIRERIGTR